MRTNGAIDGAMGQAPQTLMTDIDLFRAIFKASPIGIAIEDLDGQLLFVNPAFCSMLAFSEEELRCKHCMDFSPLEDAEKDWALFQQLRAGSIDHYQLDKRYFRRDGSLMWGRLTISVLNGRSPLILAMVDDISDKKAAEEALQESEQRFRLVADTAPVLIWMSGTDKLCTYFNKPWLDFTGRSLLQESGNGWAEGVHAEDLQRCLQTYTHSFDRREKFRMEYRLRRHDGQYRWILDIGVPRFNQDGSFAGYIGIAVDVTARMQAEQALAESEERLRLAAKAGRMFAYSWDAATDLIERSGESADILGIEKDVGASGTAISEMIHHDDKDKVESALAKLSIENPNLRITYRIVRPNGTIVWLERNSRAYFDPANKIERIVGMIVDITARKQAEEVVLGLNRRLIEAQEQERARIGRELHDDISQRLAMLGIELDELQSNPSNTQERIKELQKELAEILSDVQTLSHELHASKLEYLGAIAAMKSWCKEFGKRQKIEIDFRSDVSNPLTFEIGLCLLRILQESVHNAVKYSGVRRIEVQVTEHLNEVHLSVKDSGNGFDLEAAKRGSGIGLISMQERVRLVGGTITVESNPMLGTSVDVLVPLKSDKAAKAAG